MEHNDELDAKDQREHDADAGVGTSADDAGTHDLDLDDFGHLREDEPTDESLKTDDEGELITDEPDAADDGEKEPPFHEHPRWQEMIAERDGLKAQLEQKDGTLDDQARRINEYDMHLRMMDQYSRVAPQEAQREAVPDPFDEILSMDEEQIIDEFQKSPREFLQNFGEKIKTDALQSFEGLAYQRAQEDAVTQGLDHFAEENPDFMDMVYSGEIAQYIEYNPVHNAISAYHTLKAIGSSENSEAERETLEQQIREDERQKTLESVRVKQGAQVLDGSSATGPSGEARTALGPDIEDTEAHGGKRRVITERLKAMRERLF
jgi:hypothetical protein